MSPEDIIKKFVAQHERGDVATGDALAAMAAWMAENYQRLPYEDVAMLIQVGGVLVAKRIEEGGDEQLGLPPQDGEVASARGDAEPNGAAPDAKAKGKAKERPKTKDKGPRHADRQTGSDSIVIEAIVHPK